MMARRMLLNIFPVVIISLCLAFSSGFAQKGLSRKEAEAMAAAELSKAIARHRPIAESEWGNGKNSVVNGPYIMKFDFRIFGDKPAGGRSLYISLHGGGNAPAAVNDQQWLNQHYLYAPAEGVYLVPRAPANTWNLWHEDHIDPMLEELVKDAIVMADVSPDKVYILGYSAGGDGVFQLAPRMADHWAAAAMMAGHPGDANALSLRNLPFAIFMGGADSAYNRNRLAGAWGKQLDSLQQADPGGYIHEVHIYPDLPHWMNRKDTAAITWTAGYKRNPLPSRVVWAQDNRHHTRFYWLGTTDSVKTGDMAIADIDRAANLLNITRNDMQTLFVYLNDGMLDLDRKITVIYNGKQIFRGRLRRSAAIIRETASRLDAGLIFSVRLTLRNGQVAI